MLDFLPTLAREYGIAPWQVGLLTPSELKAMANDITVRAKQAEALQGKKK